MAKKFYITTPIYYVNARPHIGHAYTTIACDTIARRHRMLGDDTCFLTGTDEHGQKIERAAQAAGKTPQQFTDEVSAQFRGLWDRMGISYDDYIRTTSARHKQGVQALWRGSRKRVTSTKAATPDSIACPTNSTWTRRHRARLVRNAGATETVQEENYFFKLSAFQDKLLKLYDGASGVHSSGDAPQRSDFVRERSGLRDLSISRITFSWGIPVPDDPKHVIYVWLDALANYITALGYGSKTTTQQVQKILARRRAHDR